MTLAERHQARRFFFDSPVPPATFTAVLFTFTVSNPGTTDTITHSTSTPEIPTLATSPGVGDAVVSRTCRIFGSRS
jgi:hypothetical protein